MNIILLNNLGIGNGDWVKLKMNVSIYHWGLLFYIQYMMMIIK